MKLAASIAGAALIFAMGTALAAQPSVKGTGYQAKTERGQAAAQIVGKWAGYVQNVYGTTPMAWAGAMKDTFTQADLGNLKKAATMTTYEGMMGTLMGQQTSDAKVIDQLARAADLSISPMELGSPANDLVYTMVSPCRIVDTRNAVGRLSAEVTRSIAVHGANFTAQGGSNTDCGIPADPSAVVINVVTVFPDETGFLKVFPSGTGVPVASSMNYTRGGILANGMIAKTTLGLSTDLSIYSQFGTDVVVDIVGYFMAPKATALDCINGPETTDSIAANTGASVTALACPAGYTATAAFCYGTFNAQTKLSTMYSSGSNGLPYCVYQNGSASAITVGIRSRCCRVPGR